jgi:hypothetical protein
MPRKKSIRRSADQFIDSADRLDAYYFAVLSAGLGDRETTWACEAALIKLSASFEILMLSALVGAINNDTTVLSASAGVLFPRHLTDEVCEFIITAGRYFDFKGRDGLIDVLGAYVSKDHYLVEIVKKPRYRPSIEKVIALRNFAAHESRHGKAKAKEAVGMNLSSAGAWIKRQHRFPKLSADLKMLAGEIRAAAPY